jgi:serine/threonine-protein kinase
MNPKQLKLKDRYVIDRELGRGGLGIVYLAHDLLLSRTVVVKTMREDSDGVLTDPWFREKFDKEIKALTRVKHPAVVGIFDVGQLPEGQPFFVMEYVEGESLRSAMRQRRIELTRAALIVRQLGYALSAAHEMGVIHRDLKPENVMLQTLRSGEEIVKLIDFGIATVRDLQDTLTDNTTRVTGTPFYMAPEQLRGKPLPASDIWAMGVVAYEIITEQLPFYAQNVLVLAELQRAGLSASPKAIRPELPSAAQEVVVKALSFDPKARYQHAHEMGDALVRALDSIDTSSPEEIQQSDQTSALTPEQAHVLFMDLVGYSKLPMNEQVSVLRRLLDVVRNAPTFRRAELANQLIRLPTGDGLALVFFQTAVAPVQCALEIARELKVKQDLELRMGIHSGPVYRVVDINKNINVAGGGINLAQRVMDAGDAGHILVSSTVADVLIQLGSWRERLHDLGEHKVKHELSIHIFNLWTDELGNPNWPAKLKRNDLQRAIFPLISNALRQRCRELFESCDEFRSPDSLRPIFQFVELNLFERCVGRSLTLDLDQLIACLLRSGRSPARPALLDVLEQIALRYKGDHREKICEDLKDDLRREIRQTH